MLHSQASKRSFIISQMVIAVTDAIETSSNLKQPSLVLVVHSKAFAEVTSEFNPSVAT